MWAGNYASLHPRCERPHGTELCPACVQWAALHGAAAKASGALIVPCCGLDHALADFGALQAACLFEPPARLRRIEGILQVIPGEGGPAPRGCMARCRCAAGCRLHRHTCSRAPACRQEAGAAGEHIPGHHGSHVAPRGPPAEAGGGAGWWRHRGRRRRLVYRRQLDPAALEHGGGVLDPAGACLGCGRWTRGRACIPAA